MLPWYQPAAMKTALLAPLFLLALSACGDKATPDGAASGSAKAATSGSAKAATSGAASSNAASKPTAAASGAPSAAASSDPAAESGAAKEFASGDEFLKSLKLPAGAAEQKVAGMEGFVFLGPKDAKLASTRNGGKTKWGSLTFGGDSVAALLASPEQDEGAQCFKLDDAKKKLGDAKIITEARFAVPLTEKGENHKDWGDDNELLVFEKDGKRGFYVHKTFDHGDDSTHFCCAAGKPEEAADLKGTMDAAKIDAATSVCLTMTFNF